LSDAAYEPPPGSKHDGSILGGSIRVLVLGGSLGARVFSEVVPAAIARLPDAIRVRLMVTQQCRAEDLDRVRSTYAAQRISAELATFFPDVADRLRAAHLVIARAGASTVAELAIAGRPSILVPLPGAIDNHQSANAKSLADAGGAWVMPQPGFTIDSLAERLGELLSDSAALALAAMHARRVAKPGAADALADLVEQVMRKTAPATEPASAGPARGQSGRPATRTDEQPRMGQS
jgi:UDP-N-acetylglucosamine--N-acetylmuramyl-(pentapeptide) pyrophosphoryl-undecaprenol N-acetylglucosamine transferase